MERMDKKEIRKKVLKERSALREKRVMELSERICSKLRELKCYKMARDICLYMPVNNEVNVILLAETAEREGKRIWLPKVEGKIMEFYLFSIGDELTEGAFGIKEPKPVHMLKPSEDTLIIMPGAVFSKNRDRIGYGGGYYDRYLEKHRKCKTAAVCYGFQIFEDIPNEEHDIKPDILISEKDVFY